MLLTLQDRHGVRWAHPQEVASITPAHPNCWRVVLSNGEVAYALTQPFLGNTWANPKHLQKGKDPAGFPHTATTEVPDFELDGQLDADVLYLKRKGHRRWWCRDEGQTECVLTWPEALQNYPELIAIGGGLAANRSRFRRIRGHKAQARITLDTGQQLTVSRSSLLSGFANQLGLHSLEMIEGSLPLTRFRMREYPFELARASAELLHAEFEEATDLALNLLWQTAQYEREGVAHDYGRDFSRYFQHPITSTLERAGFKIRQHHFKQNLLGRLVDEYALLSFQELGFSPPARRCWQLGWRQPQVVLVVANIKPLEKAASTWAQELGISFYQIQNVDNPLHREFFLRELSQATQRPLRWLAWVHFAPGGWNDVQLIRQTADRLGIESVGKTGYLVQPEAFSEAERQQYSQPISQDSPLAQPWVKQNGGHTHSLNALRLPEQRAQAQLNRLLDSLPEIEPDPPSPPPPEPPRLLCVQDREGVRWVPFHQVASLTKGFPNRWRAVMADGSVAYLPDPLPTTAAWTRLNDAWVRPELLRREVDSWVDPAGFRFAYQELPVAPAAPPPSPHHHLLTLEKREGDLIWHTQAGEIAAQGTLAQTVARHPALVRVHKYLYVNRNRLERLFLRRQTGVMLLDNGQEIRIRPDHQAAALARQLNLGASFSLFADDRLFHYFLRDFPFELARAPGPVLKAAFPNAPELMANSLFQAYVLRLAGGPTYATTIRDFFYFPVSPMLQRAGFLPGKSTRFPDKLEAYFAFFRRTLHRFVYHYRLFTYSQLGFTPQKGDYSLGQTRPDLLLIVEKGGIPEDFARRLAHNHGVTLVLLEGQPSLMATEVLTDALRKVHPGPVSIIAYVDYDCFGWMIAEAFIKQLAFYGYQTAGLRHLVLPDAYSSAELELFARPIPQTTPAIASQSKNWIAQGGGIGGKPLGLHIDTLQPYPRVEQRFKELLACL